MWSTSSGASEVKDMERGDVVLVLIREERTRGR
jgi:hypothetical protein